MKRTLKKSGFTLVEMLVVVAIISIILSVVLFNYRDVESKSVLKNIAYEVALTIRESQSYGLGVKKYIPGGGSFTPGDNIFNRSYGVQVNDGAGESKNIYLFSDADGNGICADCVNGTCTGAGECRQMLTLHSGAEIQNICLEAYNGNSQTTQTRCTDTSQFFSASVRFQRPNPDAKFTPGDINGNMQGSLPSGFNNPMGMEVTLVNPRSPGYGQKIEVTALGQVSVYGVSI